MDEYGLTMDRLWIEYGLNMDWIWMMMNDDDEWWWWMMMNDDELWIINYKSWSTIYDPQKVKSYLVMIKSKIRDLELSLGVPGAEFRCASFMFSPIWTNIGARRRFGATDSLFFYENRSERTRRKTLRAQTLGIRSCSIQDAFKDTPGGL